jgi:hypothetical protein
VSNGKVPSLQAQGMWSAGEADDKQRFLADLRALRNAAALEWDDLAARAHYPSDVLKEAENGPALPSLPILAAYVRACDADVPEWEERWRRLGVESYADPGLPVRPAGASPAAVAGARAGVSVAPPEAYDPERIKAALRGSHGRSGRGARGTASRAAARHLEPDMPSPATVEPSTSANGNHYASQAEDRPSESAVIEMPDEAQADAIRRDPFSTDWLRDGELTSPPDSELSSSPDFGLTSPPDIGVTSSPDLGPTSPPGAGRGWQHLTEAEPASSALDDWFTPRETADREQSWSAAGAAAGGPDPSADDTETWFTPRERADGGLTLPEHDPAPPQEHARPAVTGFWTPSAPAPPAPAAPAPAAPAPAEIQRPAPPTAPELTIPRAAWPAPAETPVGDTPGPTDRTASVLARAAVAAPSLTMAGRAVPPGPVIPPSQPRSDRLYLVRLLVVIVVAALIGSVLVLLLR